MADEALATDSKQSTSSSGTGNRLVSLDAYRGFVMFLMMAEVLRLHEVADRIPTSKIWAFLAWHQTHVEWVGCTLHDLIQPSFSFIVGVALPYSIAARLSRGDSKTRLILHAFWRALLLSLLGIFLRSVGKPQTNFTFEDTLTQIGLGYGILFLLGLRPVRDQWLAFAILLVGYWIAFAAYPLPPAEFDYASVGVPADWLAEHGQAGWGAHWNKNSNLAWAFDTWFLNLFPRVERFEFNGGGYATLSFIPTLATMILGLITGERLKSTTSVGQRMLWLGVVGVVGIGVGWSIGALGICPVVKRIWTPSWTLFSGGWCCLLLGLFYGIVDITQCRRWAFPLIVIGMNSIAAYCMDHLCGRFIQSALVTHLGTAPFRLFGPELEPFAIGLCTFGVLWLILFWMYRRRLFLRI